MARTVNHRYTRYTSYARYISGFTLLELLVVLAIVGIMAGTAVFLATPSVAEEGRRLGSKTFELMQKGRVSAMLQRRVYGIEVLEDDSAVRLVVLVEQRDAFDNTTLDDLGDDFGNGLGNDLPNSQTTTLGEASDDEDATPIITYEMHKSKAEVLGLLIGQADSNWEFADERDIVEVPGKVKIGFTETSPAALQNQPPTTDDEFFEEEEEISPIVMFFPDGRLSNRGSFRFVDDEGEVVYSFTWTELGKFERVN